MQLLRASYTRPLRIGSLLLLAVAGVGLPVAAQQVASRPSATLAQRLGPAKSSARLSTEHFDLVYAPDRVTEAEAKEAARISEAAWSRCRVVFGAAPDHRLRIDLTPDFTGATGFFRPGDPKAKEPARHPFIRVRLTELDYLGLSPEYVLTHEIGHWFSGPLAGTSLGEGVADWAAGAYSGVALRPWWGKALKANGLWVDPDAYFVTGEFSENAEVDARSRTASYAESALLVRYLVERFGWPKVREFAQAYGEARGPLTSNASRRGMRLPPAPRRRGGRGPQQPDPRQPPNARAVEAAFEKLGESWPTLRADWERRMEADPVPATAAERLVLGFQTYGAIRNYEMWLMGERTPPGPKVREAVRQSFVKVNELLRREQFAAARQALSDARSYVQQLKEPRLITLDPGKIGATQLQGTGSKVRGSV
ncbi:MAG: hypothetical protein ACO1SX_26825 [Actinomycetota bacterium]